MISWAGSRRRDLWNPTVSLQREVLRAFIGGTMGYRMVRREPFAETSRREEFYDMFFFRLIYEQSKGLFMIIRNAWGLCLVPPPSFAAL